MNVVVIGAQWGDEGKGKIVDYLASRANLVVRYSGGANAGHTIVHAGKTYKLHLIPSGIIYPETKVILGTGMVIDLESLFKELEELEQNGIDWTGRVFISDRAHVVFPKYKEEDVMTEKMRRRPIGTTGRGIGVTYSKKASRDGIRIADLFDPDIKSMLTEEEKDYISPYLDKIKPLIVKMVPFMRNYREKNVLFEGAQGFMLDIDMGTYPFVSSGISAAAGACQGSGVGPRAIDAVYGVFKAYSTRVGNGPFPSEFSEEEKAIEESIREIGNEYGTTTGRARRCGYLDLVALKYACEANQLDGLVLTHLDTYDSFDKIGLCVAYEINGEETTEFPTTISELESAKPVIKYFKGWKKDLSVYKDYKSFPQEAIDYVKFIEEYTGTDIVIVSVGKDRDKTIMRKDLWKKY
ncbi:adenylosuccinate synthase [Spirochaetia bacterium 38H-sp]|uniref:Adenylosuccinate synthetase n=1 Tax=Rarispira pelagica TaxID=3141764 RepID=A0ABU9UDX4_9SPIR